MNARVRSLCSHDSVRRSIGCVPGRISTYTLSAAFTRVCGRGFMYTYGRGDCVRRASLTSCSAARTRSMMPRSWTISKRR